MESPHQSKSKCFLMTQRSFIKVRFSLNQCLLEFTQEGIINVLKTRYVIFALVLEYCQSFVLKLNS